MLGAPVERGTRVERMLDALGKPQHGVASDGVATLQEHPERPQPGGMRGNAPQVHGAASSALVPQVVAIPRSGDGAAARGDQPRPRAPILPESSSGLAGQAAS